MVERIAEVRPRAIASGLAVIDLGQGTPVDETPAPIRDALSNAGDAPGYPTAHGTDDLRSAFASWASRRIGAAIDPRDVVPTIGSKELIALLPTLLGLGAADTVVIPHLAYPTYRVGADLASCRVVVSDSLLALGPARVSIVWVNTPSNPTGQVLPPEHLHKMVQWARDRGSLLVSDECYIELAPTGHRPHSVLHPDVSGGSFDNVLALHSLSKTYSMAGYRCGFVSGDQGVVRRLLQRRRDLGLLVPTPVQAAGAAALSDDSLAALARKRFQSRREVLAAALRQRGFVVDDDQAGLFVWASLDEPCDVTVGRLADAGIVVAPGDFYGALGGRHIRLSLTASDSQVDEAAARIAELTWGWALGSPERLVCEP
ncbi:MAG: succinyldiaminopimelate transaminase [Candidatus Nanopelagicales bacterium]|nr:succinyldiaminopimelate transaminase [Candidatus Nanopelagicales bacterium]MDZ4249280.1 succinyldiaminopimelate transaminase [Candidatus Nanopelagicales bacterium]